MAKWGVEENGVGGVAHAVADDFVGRAAKGDGVVVHIAHGAHDEAGDVIQHAASLQALHHTVDVVKIFVEVLDEKNLSPGVYLTAAAHEAVEDGEVSAHDFGLGAALLVEGVLFDGIFVAVAEKDLLEALGGRVGYACRVGGDVGGHGSVERLDMEMLVDVAVEDGDVAETDNPFGALDEGGKVQLVDDSDGSVASFGAKNSANVAAVEDILQEIAPVGVATRELVLTVEQ